MTEKFDPSGGEGRKIADRTAGRAGAAIALVIWLVAMAAFDADDFAPIPHVMLIISVIFGGGWIGWRAATFIARRRHEAQQSETSD